MATKKQIEAVDLYRSLMFEARLRIEMMDFIVSGGTRLPEAIVHELCYLQLRMLCELIALGALVIHGDISTKHFKKLAKEWAPEKIITTLEGLHPNFYPQPVELILDKREFRTGSKPNALTKSELFTLYAKCGDALHRGTLKKILKSNFTYQRS